MSSLAYLNHLQGSTLGHAIFISYRRDDSEGEAGRLFDDLVRTFGDTYVFMDVAGINPGDDFRKTIEENVVSCGVLLAVIGPSWVTIKDAEGNPRLNNPNDFVHLEIGSALKRNVAVIPVLVHEAKMPHPEALPDDLKDLAYRNSVEISHARWNSDVALLTQALKSYVKSTPATEQQPVHATVSVQLPPPRPADPPAPKRSMVPVLQGAGAATLLIAGAITYFAVHSSHSAPKGSEPEQSGTFSMSTTAPPERASEPAAAPKQAGKQEQTGETDASDKENGSDRKPATQAASGGAAAVGDGEQGGAQRLIGRWMYPSARTGNSLAYLEIGNVANQVLIHAWGACQPTACDWGTRPAMLQGNVASAVFGFPADFAQTGIMRVANVKIAPGLNGLDVLVQNVFTQNGQTRTNELRLQFVPAS